MTQTQEAHGVLLNKHYAIPFEKEYAMGFPLSHLVKAITRLIAKQETILFVTDFVRLSLASLAYKQSPPLFDIFLLTML